MRKNLFDYFLPTPLQQTGGAGSGGTGGGTGGNNGEPKNPEVRPAPDDTAPQE